MNVKQAVPFFGVSSMEKSLHWYTEGLGFRMTLNWVVDGKIQWCLLELDEVSLMLQEFHTEGHDSWKPAGKPGEGVSICFLCEDALAIYSEVTARGIEAKRPFVGNGLWVTSLADPDGYRLDFESKTDVEEETEYDERFHN